MPRKFFSKFWPFILLTLTILTFFYRLFLPQPSLFITPDYGRSDSWHFSVSNKYYYWQQLQRNRIPLWNPNIGTGFPILAEGQSGVFFLPNLVLYRLLPFIFAYNLSIVIAFTTAGAGMYLFARSLALSRLASTFASLIFPISAVFVVHVQHINLLQTATVLPWLFWAINEFINKKTILFLLAFSFILAQQIFAGFPQLVFYSLVGLSIFLGFIYFSTKKINPRQLLVIGASTLFALALSAIQLLPTFELFQESTRASANIQILSQFPYKFLNLLQFLDPFILGSPSDGSYPRWVPGFWGIYWESVAYVGLIPLSLAFATLIVNLFSTRKLSSKPAVFATGTILLVSIMLSLGTAAPLHPIFSIPPFSIFRVPSRFLLLTQFSLVILAAYFVNKISRFRIITYAVIFASVVNLFIVFWHYNPAGSAKEWFKEPETATFLKKNDVSRIYSVGHGERWNEEFVSIGWQNTSYYYFARNSLDHNANQLFSIDNFEAFESIMPRRKALINSIIGDNIKRLPQTVKIENLALSLLSGYNVTHIVSPANVLNSNITRVFETEEFDGISFKTYEISGEQSRFSIVTDYVIANSVTAVKNILADENFDLNSSVILEKQPNMETSAGSDHQVSLTNETPTNLSFDITVDKDAIFVLKDSYYPGWEAFIDGKETEILAANINNRAVIVPQGNHEIEFKYRSTSFYTGALISIISVSFLLLFYINYRMRKFA